MGSCVSAINACQPANDLLRDSTGDTSSYAPRAQLARAESENSCQVFQAAASLERASFGYAPPRPGNRAGGYRRAHDPARVRAAAQRAESRLLARAALAKNRQRSRPGVFAVQNGRQ